MRVMNGAGLPSPTKNTNDRLRNFAIASGQHKHLGLVRRDRRLGGVILARAVADDAYRNEILDAVRLRNRKDTRLEAGVNRAPAS
jgi:hypothetical protein